MTANASYPAEDLQLLNQVVSDPRFQRLSMLPRVAPAELVVLFGAYLMFALSTAAGIAGWLPYPLVLLFSSLAMFAVFTPLHDAVHRSVSSHPGFNDLVGTLAALMLLPGITTRLYRYLHLEHHRHTGEPGKDPDELFISAPWMVRPLVWMFIDVHWSLLYIRRRHERPADERRAFFTALAFVVAWHAVWLLSPWATEFLLYWFVPQRLGLTLLVYLFAYIQHPADVEQHDNPFQATRMIRGGGWMRLLLLGQSQHLMHHLFPGIPFYRYHDAWVLGRDAFREREREIVWQWPFAWPVAPPPRSPRQGPATVRVRVTGVQEAGDGIRAYRLEAVEGVLPVFTAGAHIDVHVAPGIVRQYSLCSDPSQSGHWRIAVKREASGRGGSRAVHERLRAGEVLDVGLPRNHFPLRETGGRAVLVAGGIGITPLMAMAFDLHRRRQPFEFHVCARNDAAVPLGPELRQLPFSGALYLHLDDGAAAQSFTAASLPAWRAGDTLYLCGPAGFMKAVLAHARARGWPDADLVTETFLTATADPALDQPFTAELRRSGRVLDVPANRSLLDVLQANDVELVASCTQGLCGACVVTVLDGEVDHRDRVLGERQHPRGCLMTACVSRARSERIVLDL